MSSKAVTQQPMHSFGTGEDVTLQVISTISDLVRKMTTDITM